MRWMSLNDVLDAVGRRSAESKLKVYESGLVEARVTASAMGAGIRNHLNQFNQFEFAATFDLMGGGL